jgi:hypothetical protein
VDEPHPTLPDDGATLARDHERNRSEGAPSAVHGTQRRQSLRQINRGAEGEQDGRERAPGTVEEEDERDDEEREDGK